MLRTKRDVDKHVQDLLKKVSNENEVSITVLVLRKLRSRFCTVVLCHVYFILKFNRRVFSLSV